MALTINDNRTVINEADATTGWTATDGPAVFTAEPDPIESNACLGMQVSNGVEDAYFTQTSSDFSTGSISIWMLDRAEFASTVTGGIGIQVGDGTNRIAYHVGGNDGTAFRHDTGPVKWACFLLDLANKPANSTTIAGAEANLNETTITQVGVRYDTDVKSVGGTDNCFWDIMRFAAPGVGIEVYGGTSGTPESLSTLAVLDRSTGNLQAYGIIRQLATGVYGIQGNINLGDITTTNDTYINITDEVIVFENRNLSSANYYRFNVSGSVTGTTEVEIRRSSFSTATGASAGMILDDINSSVLVVNSTFSGINEGIILPTSQSIDGNTFNGCGLLTLNNSSTFTNNTVQDSIGDISITTPTPNNISDCTFISDGSNHAIEITQPGVYDFSGNTFTNYFSGSSPTTDVNAVIYNNSGGSVTLNVSDTTGVVSYRNEGISTTTINNNVSVTLTGLQENTEVRVLASGSNTELAGIENAVDGISGSREFTFSLSALTETTIKIHSLQYQHLSINYVIPSTTAELPVQQVFDRNYSNP